MKTSTKIFRDQAHRDFTGEARPFRTAVYPLTIHEFDELPEEPNGYVVTKRELYDRNLELWRKGELK